MAWTYKALKDQNASSDQDSFDKTCISLYVKDMTDMSIKYGWTGHTAIAYFDLAPWAMNSFEEKEKLIGYVINRDTGGYISQSGYGYGRYGKYQKYRKYAELDEETMNTEDTL